MEANLEIDPGDQSAGTYKAEAELDNVIQLYADIDPADVGGYPVYAKIGQTRNNHNFIIKLCFVLSRSRCGGTYNWTWN